MDEFASSPSGSYSGDRESRRRALGKDSMGEASTTPVVPSNNSALGVSNWVVQRVVVETIVIM